MAFRSSNGNAATTSSLVVTAPAGIVSGDVLIAGVIYQSGTLTPPSGWTQAGTTISITSGSVEVWKKVAGGFEPGSYTWGLSGSARFVVNIAAFSGIDNTTPIDAGPSQADGTGSTATATTITPSGSGQDLVAIFASSNTSGVTWTAPGTMTEREDRARFEATSSLDTEVFTSGATGSRAATLSSSAKWAAFLLALNTIQVARGSPLIACFP